MPVAVMNFGAIVFDFDGTLVDSAKIKEEAFGRLYANESEDIIALIINYHRNHEGVSRFAKFQYWEEKLLGRVYSETKGCELSQKYSDSVFGEVIKAPYIEGAYGFLKNYHERIPLYVASATPETELRSIVSHRKMGHFFRGVYGAPNSKADILKNIKNKLGKDVKLLMVGDALSDHDSANEAGVPFLGIVSKERENPFPPDVEYLSHLSSLPYKLGINT